MGRGSYVGTNVTPLAYLHPDPPAPVTEDSTVVKGEEKDTPPLVPSTCGNRVQREGPCRYSHGLQKSIGSSSRLLWVAQDHG